MPRSCAAQINIRAMRKILALLAFVLTTAHAADFPSKPVRFVTGANAGSTGDVLGRVLADNLATLWKQPTIVDNRPGGGGVIASQATLAFVAEIPLVIGARPDLPYKSIPELVAYAKANPDKVNYAANTPGTFPNLATEYFSQQAGIKMRFIPYKGSAPALADVMGGRLDLVVEGVAALGGAIKGGQLRPLGVTSTRRDPTRSEEHTSELQSPCNLVCRLLLDKKKNDLKPPDPAHNKNSDSTHQP